MLNDRNSSAIVAVGDLDRARRFYEDTLGLTRVPGGEESGVLGFRTGGTVLIVYRSDHAGTNAANAVAWDMKGDLVQTVRGLRERGIAFENYGDMEGMTFNEGVYSAGTVKLAWFRDPDGNILHLNEGM